MKKRLYISFFAISISIICLLTFMFIMKYESTPSKRTVEKMVQASNLQEFGDVEGSYLYTPNNYAYFNINNIFVVEKSLSEEEQYNNQYVIIKPAEKITEEDQELVEKIQEDITTDSYNIKSRHKVIVYKNGKKVSEEFCLKIIFTYVESNHLSFVSLKEDDVYYFNFFTKGYNNFLDF